MGQLEKYVPGLDFPNLKRDRKTARKKKEERQKERQRERERERERENKCLRDGNKNQRNEGKE